MPIIRKVFIIGDSRAVTLPATWLQFFEEKIGHPIKFVALEVNDTIKITPYIPQEPYT